MTKQIEGQLTLEELFGVSMSAPNPSKPAKPPKGDTGTATKTRRQRTRKTAERTATDSPVTPRQRKSSVALHAVTPDPDHISEETARLIETVIEAAKKKPLYPGDKVRIEEAVQQYGEGTQSFIVVVNALSDTIGEPWTICEDGTAVKFTRGYIMLRDKQGKLEHVTWTPVHKALCELIQNNKWLSAKERKRDREEGEGMNRRRHKW